MWQVVETHAQVGNENAHARECGAARVALGTARQRAVGARPNAVAERGENPSLPFGSCLETRQTYAQEVRV